MRLHRLRSIAAFLIFSFSAFAQTAQFPGAIAADKHLTVQTDKAVSLLTGSVLASATSFTVVSGSKFRANQIVTIENEQMLVCSVATNTISVGYSACPNIDGRGYAGTTAASHATGLSVSANVVAWNHNAMAAEIKAIENALGVNLAAAVPNPLTVARGGTGAQTVPAARAAIGTPSLVAADYNFTAQQPGGSLSVGSNTVTLAPCPLGVNGSDSGHRYYLSGGTGTAEAALSTGGTCTAGATTGTLILTVANSHSGAWTIASATGGVAEAQQSLVSSGGGEILITASITFHAAVTAITNTHVIFQGMGANGPGIILRASDYSAGQLFTNTVGATWTFKDLFFNTSIGVAQTGAAIHQTSGALFTDRVVIFDGQYGIWCGGCTGKITDTEYVQLDYSFRPVAGFYLSNLASSLTLENVYTTGSNLDSANEMGAGLYFYGTDSVSVKGIFTGADSGIIIDNSGANYNVNDAISNSIVIDNRSYGITVFGNAAACSNLSFTGNLIQGDSDGSSGGVGQGYGVNWGGGSTPSCDHVVFNANTVTGWRLIGLYMFTVGKDSISLTNNVIFDNDRAAAGGQSGIVAAAGSTGLAITGNSSKNITGLGAQPFGLSFLGTITATVVGNDFYPNSNSAVALGGGTISLVMANNKGVDDVIGSVASGASVDLPVNPIVTVTGTTGVGAVTSIWEGRRLTIITPDGAVTFTAGGTIGNTITSVQNKPLSGVVSGGKLYLQ